MPKKVETILHTEATRTNIPPAEFQMAISEDVKAPVQVSWERRNPDLDPQLVWRGKYDGDDTLTVQAPAIFKQERISPKDLVEALIKEKEKAAKAQGKQAGSLFDFIEGGFQPGADRMDFYRHEQNWSNRFILGDSLQVMASLAEREGLRGKVQCVYFDPPYGIKFQSNFQWCTTSRDVKDGKLDNMTREPEQIRAFRDTWKDGIHSYLSYIRDRLIVARDLLADSGSIFLQIGEENVHRVRCVMDEVFGENNFISQISFATTTSFTTKYLPSIFNYILWYGKNKDYTKYNNLFIEKEEGKSQGSLYKIAQNIDWMKNNPININTKIKVDNIISQGKSSTEQVFVGHGKEWSPPQNSHWKTSIEGMYRLEKASRILYIKNSIQYIRKFEDFPLMQGNSNWNDVSTGSFTADKIYVVQTNEKVIARCLLMASDPGDLVLDPTCGSGTTAYVAEQWGRRWITIDTSRVAIALAKARIMGASFPYYLLADSKAGQEKEAEVSGIAPSTVPTGNSILAGFVCERVPHVKLSDIAKNTEIDVIYDEWQKQLEPLRESLNAALGEAFEEWEIPREADDDWPAETKRIHAAWWKARLARQEKIDASIAQKASFELLYDKPFVDKGKVRVTGPFTVDSVSPYRSLNMDEDGNLVDPASRGQGEDSRNYLDMILENLQAAGIQQAHKDGRLVFTNIARWPGEMLSAVGEYEDEGGPKKAGIFIGPEFGTVGRPDIAAAAREAAEAGFSILVAAAFSFDAQANGYEKFGALPVLKTRMNTDLHMGGELKETSKGNLFVIFGEPDIEILPGRDKDGKETGNIRVKVRGVDVFNPVTGDIRSSGTDGIAAWFIDDDYNEECFFVRQAYFLGAKDPYKALRTSLKAEISADAWDSMHSDVSRPFKKPESGRIAVKVINILGDEVLKVFRV